MITHPLLMTPEEIGQLTGRMQPAAQVKALKVMGFWMATLTPAGVCLPRAHYSAVCAGAVPAPAVPAGSMFLPRANPPGLRLKK